MVPGRRALTIRQAIGVAGLIVARTDAAAIFGIDEAIERRTLVLGEVVIADVTLTRALTSNLELFVTAENVGNARIETGRTSGDEVSSSP